MRKNKFAVGDIVLTEDTEGVVKILEAKPCKMSIRSRSNDSWEYRVELDGETLWVSEYSIVGKQLYQPVTISSARHLELCQDLIGYEHVRDYLETLKPKTKHDKVAVRLLKEAMENLALMFEGDGREARKATEELESLMR